MMTAELRDLRLALIASDTETGDVYHEPFRPDYTNLVVRE